MKPLDSRDHEILAILASEARIPLKTLAARIGLSRSATGERVAYLEKAGIIRGYRADIALASGKGIAGFLFVTVARTPALDVLDHLQRQPEVLRVSSVSGQLDLVVEVEVATIERFNAVRDLVASHPNVGDVTSQIVLRRDIDRRAEGTAPTGA